MKKIIGVIICLLFIGVITYSQNQTEVRLSLRDGSSFSGKTTMGNVTLITDYGKLEIPLQNVTSLDLGIPSDKSNESKIINLIKQMGNSDENMRKSAYEELTKMTVGAIQVISDFIYSEKYQPAEFTDYTPESALSELKSIYGIDESVSDKDVITIDGQYTMGGRYDLKKIDLKTEFGMLSIPKEKIKHVDVLYTPTGDGSDKNFILLGSKHISANSNGGWLKTGIMLKQGQKITITASGEISFASLSNNKYKPDGKVAGSTTSTTTDYDYGEGDYGGSAYPTYGNVVYKIGETGTVLKAGAKFNGTVQSSGMLFLSVYETVYNASNTGSYSVKVLLK
ncbi:MAG: hypothetical protein HY063_11765 [Bacteroidetes bacterium]|nr:hypothetical protein [Bacteroidota bacterium]